jgi:hypothetical protein
MATKWFLAQATTSWARKGPHRPPFVVVKGSKYELDPKDIPKGLKDVLVEVEPDPTPPPPVTSVSKKKAPAKKKAAAKPKTKSVSAKPATPTVVVTPDDE